MNKHDHELRLTAALMTNPVYGRRFDELCGWFNRENTEHILGDKVSIKAQFSERSPINLDLPDILICDRSKGDRPHPRLVPKHPKTDEDFVSFILLKNKSCSIWEFTFDPKSLHKIDIKNNQKSYMHLFDIHFDMHIQPDERFSASKDSGVLGGLVLHYTGNNTFGIAIIESLRSITIKEYQELTGDDPILAYAKKAYFDPIYYEENVEKWAFDEFLEHQRDRFNQTIGVCNRRQKNWHTPCAKQ